MRLDGNSILIVDADRECCAELKRVLTSHGENSFEISKAYMANCKRFLAHLLKKQIDVNRFMKRAAGF